MTGEKDLRAFWHVKEKKKKFVIKQIHIDRTTDRQVLLCSNEDTTLIISNESAGFLS